MYGPSFVTSVLPPQEIKAKLAGDSRHLCMGPLFAAYGSNLDYQIKNDIDFHKSPCSFIKFYNQ